MKKFCLFVLMIVLVSSLYATAYHSVDISSEVYRIIDTAEERGIIETQSDVRPYNLNTVRRLLGEIKTSSLISSSEAETIETILREFDSIYGMENNTSEDRNIFGSTRIGAVLTTTQKGGFVIGSDKIFDSRNGAAGYIMGDILGVLSYDLNVKMNGDRIDTNAYLPTELLISTDGFYLGKYEKSGRLEKLPDSRIYLGVETLPEISTSIRNDIVTARIGAVKRDWGPGRNNLALSGSARVFDAFELSLRPASWFSYSVLTGSLGQVSLESVNDVDWPSENLSNKNGKYSNNFSLHRVELSYKGIKAGVWESVVWRKRFELSYINPLSIYILSQNALGDYDNCVLGGDISYTWRGVGTFYFAAAADEFDSLSSFFTWPRNMLSYQAGASFPLSFGNFTELRVQGTYIPAFFGAHYADTADLFGGAEYSTAYVNKGQNIGYPVNPDTIELLFELRTTLSGWNFNFFIKDQMRSAQYSYKRTGTDILTFMDYDACNNGDYKNRDFFSNIWNNILDVEFSFEKRIEKMTFYGGLAGIVNTSRDFNPEVRTSSEGYQYNPGIVEFVGEWNSRFSLVATFGMKIVF